MAPNIGQSLLENTEHGGRNVRRNHFPYEHSDFALNAGPGLEFLDLPFHGGRQTQIQDSGPQLCRDSANGLNHAVGQLTRGADPSEHLAVSGRQPPRQPGEIHFHRGQRLAQFIVDFPGDPGPLLLSNGQQVRRKIPELLAGSAQRLLGALHLGQVRSDQADSPRAVQAERIQGEMYGQSSAFSRLQTDLAPAVPLGRAPE